MQITVTRTDHISPRLRRAVKELENRKPITEAMGLYLTSWTVRAFDDASLRPAPWPSRQGMLPRARPLLKLSGSLWRSIKSRSTNDRVTISSDRKYAAIHQLGGTTSPHIIKARNKKYLFWPGAGHPVKSVKHPGSRIPARPFMPFLGSGGMMPAAREGVEDVIRVKVLEMLQ